MVARAAAPQIGDDAVRGEGGAEIAAGHAVPGAVAVAWRAAEIVGDRQRCADCAAGIARRGLDPHSLEGAFTQDLAVGDAVQCHAAGEAEIARPGLLA